MPAIAVAVFACLPMAWGQAPPPSTPGSVFQDCPHCPRMVVIPAGRFVMGSPAREPARASVTAWDSVPDRDAAWERPQHAVSIAQPFVMGQHPVTVGEWEACVAEGGCHGNKPNAETPDQPNSAITSVSWNDAQAYVAWLNGKAGATVYRLPSEAEWEYAARAGTTTDQWWAGDHAKHRYDDYSTHIYWSYRDVGQEPANSFGVQEVLGDLWQWTADCWNDSYVQAPADGSAWQSGECRHRVVRGGEERIGERPARSAARSWRLSALRDWKIGFRVVRSMP